MLVFDSNFTVNDFDIFYMDVERIATELFELKIIRFLAKLFWKPK